MKRILLTFILIIYWICMFSGCGKLEDKSNTRSISDLGILEDTSNDNAISNTNHTFEVYIGEAEQNRNICIKDQFVLNEDPLFTHEDIKAYLWQTHDILFTDAFLVDRLDNVRDNYILEGGSLLLNADPGDIFVIVVNGERIYHGYFARSSYSSHIDIGMGMEDIDYGIHLAPMFGAKDTRDDNRIYDVLNVLGILDEEPVNQLIQDKTYYHRSIEVLGNNIEEILELLEEQYSGECNRSSNMRDMAKNIEVVDGIVYYPMNYTYEDYYYECKVKGTPIDLSNYSWEIVDLAKLFEVKSLIDFATEHFIHAYMEIHGNNVEDFKIESATYEGIIDNGGYMVHIAYLVLPIDDTKPPPSYKGFIEPKSDGYYWESRMLFIDNIDGIYTYREVFIN